jgi:Fis family transcriptional regulator
MVLHEMEKPLLEIVMKHAKSNQCKAADILGINRNTLRKKLKLHKLDK